MSITKQSQIICDQIVEKFTYDPTVYIEADGSLWYKIFHHNNPASKLFGSSNTFTNGVYIDEDRWFNINICNQFSKWELIAEQLDTSSSTLKRWRWIQSKNPMTCAYGDVDYADITYITDGYSTSSYGGLYYKNSSTYLCQNNGNSGNWWGAVGSWTKYSGGIPGWNQTACTTGYLNLYLRIDNGGVPSSLISCCDAPARVYKDGTYFGNQFYEN